MATGLEIMLKLSADNRDLKAKLTDAQKQLGDLKNKTDKSANGITASFGKIGRAVATFFGIQQAYRFIKFAGELDSVSTAFYNLSARAQGGGEAILAGMRAASAGTMSGLEMMRSANLAMQLMGDDVIQYLPQMTSIARAAAKSQGKEVAEMMQNLVVATGRQSILILDNLGISSAKAGAYMDQYARSIGTTREKMTEAQKQQAFFYAAMRAGGELVREVGSNTLTFGEQIQVVEAFVMDAAGAVAESLTPGLYNLVDAFEAADGSGNMLIETLKVLGKSISMILTSLSQLPNMARYFWSGLQGGNERRQAEAAMQRYMDYQDDLVQKYGDVRNASEGEKERLREMMEVAQRSGESSVRSFNDQADASERVNAAFRRLEATRRTHTNTVRRQTQAQNENAEASKKEEKAVRQMSDVLSFLGEEALAERVKVSQQFNMMWGNLDNISRELQNSFRYTAYANMMEYEILNTRLQEAYAAREQEIIIKRNVMLNSMQEGFSKSIQTAMNSFETATKDALKETLFGKGGWKEWRAAMKELLKQLVVDLMYAIAKALLLKAITAAIGGPTAMGGTFFGGVIKGAFFEKGYIPSYANGCIPVLANGMMPADHFPAYIGTREAVINAESTRANLPLLAAMNANPGMAMGGGGDMNIVVNAEVDGEVLFRVNEKRRQERATALGMQNYGRRSVYR